MNASRQHNGKPTVPLYTDDSAFEEKHRQWKRVEAFFVPFINPADQARLGEINTYEATDEFRKCLSDHLKELIRRQLEESLELEPPAEPPAPRLLHPVDRES